MNISRYMSPEMIKLEMESEFSPPEGENGYSKRQILNMKETILSELTDLLDHSGKVSNKKKLSSDLFNREKKATTAIGRQIAIPHVRTMQAKEFILAVGRHADGYEFDAPDGKPVRLFFCMAAPPYDDNLYLKVFRSLAERINYPGFVENLIEASDPHLVIRAFKELE